MGVQKVLTHVLLLCGSLVKQCEEETLSGNNGVSFGEMPQLSRDWHYKTEYERPWRSVKGVSLTFTRCAEVTLNEKVGG